MIEAGERIDGSRATFLNISKKSLFDLLAFVLLLTALAAIRPLSYPDEGRYAEIGRWMLQSGDWLTPRLDGMPFFHKPPLLYWMEAMFFASFGAHPWVARLTPVLHASVMLFAVYVIAHRLGSDTLAKRAVGMVGTSLAFLAGGQYVNHDLMVATWISVAIGSFAMAFLAGEKPNRQLAWLGFVACGLGILSKGLIGLVLPGLVLLIWLGWTRQLKKIMYLPWFSGLALLAVIALPWFALEEQRFPGMLNYMFGLHHFQRFTGSAFNNNEPWWFYLAGLVVLFFPWVFFSLAQAIQPFRQRFLPHASTKAEPEDISIDYTFHPALISLCWIWVIAIVGFFSFPSAKIIGYVLPVIPPLAILAVMGWRQALGHLRHERKFFLGFCVVNVAIGLGLTIAVGQHTEKNSALDVAQIYTCLAKPGDTVYVMDGFPYDLPFSARLTKPMRVVQDWATLRQIKSDNWHSELIDAADFDPVAAQVLQSPAQLAVALTQAQPGNWLLAASDSPHTAILANWHTVKQGTAWTLYSATPLSPGETALAQAATLPSFCKGSAQK